MFGAKGKHCKSNRLARMIGHTYRDLENVLKVLVGSPEVMSFVSIWIHHSDDA